jgi:hypothetical protein
MDNHSYLKLLKKRYKHYYNVFEGCDKCMMWNVDLISEYIVRHERSAFTRKLVLYAQEEYEYCFIRTYDKPLSISQVLDFADLLKGSIEHFVQPHSDHVKTILTGVMITDKGCHSDVFRVVTKFRFSKPFKFYLHGWCEIRLVVVDLLNGAVFHNLGKSSRFKRQLMNFYEFFRQASAATSSP